MTAPPQVDTQGDPPQECPVGLPCHHCTAPCLTYWTEVNPLGRTPLPERATKTSTAIPYRVLP